MGERDIAITPMWDRVKDMEMRVVDMHQKNTPHVVMLTNAVAPDKLGGLERYVGELSSELAHRGVQVTVIAKQVNIEHSHDEIQETGVRILRYSVPSKSDPFFALRYASDLARGVRELLKNVFRDSKVRPVLHGHFPAPMGPVLQARIPYLYTFHAPVYKEIISERQGSYLLPPVVAQVAVQGMRGVERRVVRRAAEVFTLSDFMANEAEQLDPSLWARHVLVPGGIDTDAFAPRSISTPDIEHAEGSPVLFTARRLVERTGVENLVEAMPAVLSRYPDARLYVAGSGPRRAAIEAQLQALGIEKNVRLLGYISEAELVDWYRRADVAVTPTKALEGFGLSTAEALSVGTLAAVTPVGANAEVVTGLDPALVLPDASPSGIAAGLNALLGDTAQMAATRSKARSYAVDRFGWDAICSRYIDSYERAARD